MILFCHIIELSCTSRKVLLDIFRIKDKKQNRGERTKNKKKNVLDEKG